MAAAAAGVPSPVNSSLAPAPAVQQPPPGPNLKEVFRTSAIAALTKRLQGSMASANTQAVAKFDELFAVQQQLTQKNQETAAGVARVQAERSALEASVLETASKAAELESWLAASEARAPHGDVDPEAAIMVADPLSQQALDAQAEDMAIEDALYTLDKALQASIIDPQAYLKQVRALCRQQFFVRQLGNKVADRQHQLQAASSRAANSAAQRMSVQMPQGDSWANTGILANPLAGHR
jgi:ESCRT-I complex subunit TSG101